MLKNARRIVVKLGTKVTTSGIGQLNVERIHAICTQLAEWRREGREVMVVSSGAVGTGMGRLGWQRKPRKLAELQLCAAVGQSLLTETWQHGLAPHGLSVAQVLLTRGDVAERRRHLALRGLLEEALSREVIPLMNENDPVSVDELKFGDNDVLSALVASLMKADALVILSTAPGVVNPSTGEIIPFVERIGPELRAMARGPGDITSTGGMVTKLQAAEIATQSGCAVLITSGAEPEVLRRAMAEPSDLPGTRFAPHSGDLNARRRFLAFFEQPQGAVTVDAGAVAALTGGNASLLAKGCLGVTGGFAVGATISVLDTDGAEIARGRAGFSSGELASTVGLRSAELEAKFPDRARYEVIYRDDLVVLI